MELLILLVIVFAVASFVGRLSMRRRRALAEEERRQAAAVRSSRGGGDSAAAGAAMSPFGLFPFGGLFEQLLSQPGLSRSYVFDERTGQWIDVSEQEPEPVEEQPQKAADGKPQPRKRRETSAFGRAGTRR